MYQKNPLSPHLQIYGWHISSLLSITHRIIGIVNIIAVTLICLWTISLLFGEENYENIKMTATCVRVPVRTSHSESVNIEFKKSYNLQKVRELLKKAPGCKVIDTQKNGGYMTPFEAEGSYLTYISRIRKDNSNKKAINLWIVSDNLLKGAALNAVQIAQTLIKKYIK